MQMETAPWKGEGRGEWVGVGVRRCVTGEMAFVAQGEG